MQNCKKDAMITKRAVVLDVTPEEDMTENNNLNESDNIQIASFDPNLVKDKKLERFLISLSVTGDGKIEGSAAGRDVSGDWNWIDGYFCRTLMWGERELKYNCQKVTFDGRRLRFISDRGAGQSASFALR